MAPSLVNQVDRKGEMDLRGNAAAFDLPKSSGQFTSRWLTPPLLRIRVLVGFDLSPSGCLQPHLQPLPWEQIMGVSRVSKAPGCGGLESAKAGRGWG